MIGRPANLALSLGVMLTAVFAMGGAVRGDERFDVYFLSVGSTFYASSTAADQHAFTRLRGANKSARMVAERFQRAGSRFGILLTSDDQKFVSLGDINAALDRATAEMRTQRPPSPFLLFYFAGHGISEGVGWNHFSVPGTFLYYGILRNADPGELSKRTLHAATLPDKLNRLHVPYMMIIDTCYEGEAADFQSPILTGPAIESLKNVASVLRFMNEFHQRDPVLFSTPPGSVVPTAFDPSDPLSDPVAPLARRMMILFDSVSNTRGELTLTEFVRRMTSPDFDKETSPAITHAEPAAHWGRLVFFQPETTAPIDIRNGTASAGEVCCGPRRKR